MTEKSKQIKKMGKWTRRAFIGTGGLIGVGLVVGIGGNNLLALKEYFAQPIILPALVS